MIPKIIHYCHFGPAKLSALEKRCMASWRKYCPDYQIRCWTEKDLDLSRCRYAREAMACGAWAFLSDYARNVILAEHGGIYLDTDVELLRPLDPLLDRQGFCGVEEHRIATGLGFGAVPHHPVVEALAGLYEKAAFLLPDGSRDLTTNTERQHPVFRRAGFAEERSGEIRTFSGMTVFPPEYFCPKSFRDGSLHITENTFSIHHYRASWASPASRIGYHLRRIAGEHVYSLVRRNFKAPQTVTALVCFLLVLVQNLRGILNYAGLGGGLTGTLLALLMILLAGSVLGVRLLLHRPAERRWFLAMAAAAALSAVSRDPVLLWCFILGGVMAGFPFRSFARYNVITLAVLLVLWLLPVITGVMPSGMTEVKKVVWINVFDFGFTHPNTLSLFLFQLTAFLCIFIRDRVRMMLMLIPLAALIFTVSGGRCFTLAMIVMVLVRFLPERLQDRLGRQLGTAVVLLLGLSLLLAYFDPRWHILTLLNDRPGCWHFHLMQNAGPASLLFGRRISGAVPLDSAYLMCFIRTGILGTVTYLLLMFAALQEHRHAVKLLLPVFAALIFAGFFEAPPFGSGMLGLLPVWFFFHSGEGEEKT